MSSSTAVIPIYAEGARGEQYYPVKASAEIYTGCMAIVNAGYLADGANTASCSFGGVAKDRATGGASDGLVVAKVAKSGCYWFLLSGGALTDLNKECYLSDNQTVVVADPGTGSIKVGRIEALSDSSRRKRSPTNVASAGYTWALVRIDTYC